MDQSAKRRLVKLAAKYNFILIVVGISIRPFIIPTPLSYLPWALLNIFIYGLVYFLIRSDKLGKYSTFAVFSSTFFALISLLILSGGINGHIAYLIPLVPVFAGLILSERGFWITSTLNIVLIVVMALLSVPVEVTFMPPDIFRKMVWLILATIIGAGFARSYAKENELLTHTLKHEANIDYLTKILNRRGIEQNLKQQISLASAYRTPICLMMIDLDHFKRYNDANGHIAGDQCLMEISQVLNDLVRAENGFIGRYGGEEFIVVLSEPDLNSVDDFAWRLNAAIRGLTIFLKKGQPELLTASVGYCYREAVDILDVESMIACADAKLYECKSEGRDLVRGDILVAQPELSLSNY